MKNKIAHPKVFISYAWGTEEHDEKVIALATSLKGDGVGVVFDKWQLKEGNDTYSFMEKSVLDESVTNVLILIDPIYEMKANERTGGVGTETQIISSEVYNKVDQRKFIPVIFERDDEGNVRKPQYLKGLLHFDLSMPDSYDNEYRRMVRSLYGIDTYKEPELGKPPAWLDETSKVSYKSRVTVDFFRGSASDVLKENTFSENLEELKRKILEYEYVENEIVSCYCELIPFRDEFLLLVKSNKYVQEGYKKVAKFLEELMYEIRRQQHNIANLKNTFVHECYIYMVAYYLKKSEKEALRYTLNKTFYTGTSNFNQDADSYNSFYYFNDELNNAVCKRDNKEYYCGTAALWIENLNVNVCNKDEFVLGDLFCYNASYLIKNYEKTWAWFPLTYIYNRDEYMGLFAKYSKRLVSKEYLKDICYILDFESVDEFIKKYKKIEEKLHKGELKKHRYNSVYETASVFWDYIESEKLCTRN